MGGHCCCIFHREQVASSRLSPGQNPRPAPVITAILPDKGAPGAGVTIHGFGFDFVALRFGAAAPNFAVSGDTRISTGVPGLGVGEVSIKLSNPDGKVSTRFRVLPRPTKDRIALP